MPLCGKTLDMPWLAAQGHQVIGAELVEQAVSEFAEQNLSPRRSPHAYGVRYEVGRISVLRATCSSHEGAHAPTGHGHLGSCGDGGPPADPSSGLCRAGHPTGRGARRRDSAERIRIRFGRDVGSTLRSARLMYNPCFQTRRWELFESTDGAERVSRPDRPVSRFDILTWLIEHLFEVRPFPQNWPRDSMGYRITTVSRLTGIPATRRWRGSVDTTSSLRSDKKTGTARIPTQTWTTCARSSSSWTRDTESAKPSLIEERSPSVGVRSAGVSSEQDFGSLRRSLLDALLSFDRAGPKHVSFPCRCRATSS